LKRLAFPYKSKPYKPLNEEKMPKFSIVIKELETKLRQLMADREEAKGTPEYHFWDGMVKAYERNIAFLKRFSEAWLKEANRLCREEGYDGLEKAELIHKMLGEKEV